MLVITLSKYQHHMARWATGPPATPLLCLREVYRCNTRSISTTDYSDNNQGNLLCQVPEELHQTWSLSSTMGGSKLETWDFVAVALYFTAVLAAGLYVSSFVFWIELACMVDTGRLILKSHRPIARLSVKAPGLRGNGACCRKMIKPQVIRWLCRSQCIAPAWVGYVGIFAKQLLPKHTNTPHPLGA